MPIEQEPIKIVIPVEEESAFRPEQSSSGVGDTVTQTSRQLVTRARAAWESEQRHQTQAVAQAGARHGASAAKSGLKRGLNWLSTQLANLASRLDE